MWERHSAQTLHERRDQFHTLRLGEYLDPFNAAVHSFIRQAEAFFLQQTGDPVAVAANGLAGSRLSCQTAGLGAGLFRLLLGLCRLVLGAGARGFFMKRSVAEKGAHVGAE